MGGSLLLVLWPVIWWALKKFARFCLWLFPRSVAILFLYGVDYFFQPVSMLPFYYLPPLHPQMAGGVHAWLRAPLGPNYPVSFWRAQLHARNPFFILFDLIILGLAFLAILGPWLWRRQRRNQGGQGALRIAPEATHGSARWRRPAEMARTVVRTSTEKPNRAGLVMGSDRKTCYVARPEVGNPHVLIIGATRSGKTRRVILPTVWTLGHARQSMVLTDPKGELHAHSATWLREQGYCVVLVDLLRPTRGNRWNPLAAIRAAHDAGDAEEAARLAWELGNVLAADVGAGTDPIWPQAEESLIAALALGAALEAPEGARHPATMYRVLSELGGDGEGGKALDEWFRSLGHDHPARRAYGTAALSESRTRSSIYTGTAAHLRTFGDPGISWLTAESDHDPADVGRRPTAVFLLLPDEGGARNSVAALYISQLYSALVGVAREQADARLPVPVSFLLDEVGNVGKIPDLDRKLTVAAGRGIRFALALQSLSQLGRYGRDAQQTITGNCDTWLYLRTADEVTAKVISTRLGSFTVRTTSHSRSARGPAFMGASEGATGRPLLMPDEVTRWPTGRSLIIQAGEYPAQLPLQDLSAWRGAAAAFVPAPPAAPQPLGDVRTWSPWDQEAVAPVAARAAVLAEPPEAPPDPVSPDAGDPPVKEVTPPSNAPANPFGL